MGIHRQIENLENKANRVYAHVLEQIQTHFPNQKILICKVNNIELRDKIRQSCEDRNPGGFLTLPKEIPINWYVIVGNIMYATKMETVAALKSYTVKILSVEQSTLEAGTSTPSQALPTC